MDLNSIQLTPEDVAQLYSRSLISTDKRITSENNEEKPSLKFLGDNKKNVLIVVDYPGVTHIPDNQLAFLTKLLAACKLGLGDVAVLNFQHFKARGSNDLQTAIQPKTVLLFGIDPTSFGLPLSFPFFQVQSFNNATYIYSPSLDEIESDRDLKTSLWASLKKIFNL